MNQASVGVHCPECVKNTRQKVYTPSTMPGSQGYITTALVAVNVAIWVATIVLGDATVSSAGSTFAEYGTLGRGRLVQGGPIVGVAEGEWWRLISGGFLHSGLIHIGFNMYLLWQLGKQLERVIGEMNFAAMYTTALLGGSFGAMLLDANGAHGGASGAVFGLFAITAMLYRERGIQVMQTGLGRLIILNLLISFAPGISLGGHFGGFIAGGIIGYFFFGLHAGDGSPFGKNKQMPLIATVILGVLLFVGGIWAASANVL